MFTQYHKCMMYSLRDRVQVLGMIEIVVITLASIIEGEALYDKERPIIAGVYHNRLQKGMKLQADPTIQYIIDDGPRRLLKKDLMIESPYNTYLNKGLPPGPINNPGEKSILAALFPLENDFLAWRSDGGAGTIKTKNGNMITNENESTSWELEVPPLAYGPGGHCQFEGATAWALILEGLDDGTGHLGRV